MIVKTNYKFATLPSTQERNKEVKRILGIDGNNGNKILRNEDNNFCPLLPYGTNFCDLDSLVEIVDILNKTSCKKVFLEVETCQKKDMAYTYYFYLGNYTYYFYLGNSRAQAQHITHIMDKTGKHS